MEFMQQSTWDVVRGAALDGVSSLTALALDRLAEGDPVPENPSELVNVAKGELRSYFSRNGFAVLKLTAGLGKRWVESLGAEVSLEPMSPEDYAELAAESSAEEVLTRFEDDAKAAVAAVASLEEVNRLISDGQHGLSSLARQSLAYGLNLLAVKTLKL